MATTATPSSCCPLLQNCPTGKLLQVLIAFSRTLLSKFLAESEYTNSNIISFSATPFLGCHKDVAISRNPELQELLKEASEACCLSLINECT